MEKESFVQKVKDLCSAKGIKPTNACKESGVGGSFLSDINRGQIPSVAKVQMLADYLGVTTSELLGEEKEPTPVPGDGLNETAQRFMPLVDKLTPDQQQLLLTQLQAWTGQNGQPAPAAPAPDAGKALESDS